MIDLISELYTNVFVYEKFLLKEVKSSQERTWIQWWEMPEAFYCDHCVLIGYALNREDSHLRAFKSLLV